MNDVTVGSGEGRSGLVSLQYLLGWRPLHVVYPDVSAIAITNRLELEPVLSSTSCQPQLTKAHQLHNIQHFIPHQRDQVNYTLGWLVDSAVVSAAWTQALTQYD